MDGTRMKGRGRAHIFRKGDLPKSYPGSTSDPPGVGHGKVLKSTENLMQSRKKDPITAERSSSLKNHRLTHANQRLPSTALKHNPARKTPSTSECRGDDSDDYPYLPSQAFNAFKSTSTGFAAGRRNSSPSSIIKPTEDQKDGDHSVDGAALPASELSLAPTMTSGDPSHSTANLTTTELEISPASSKQTLSNSSISNTKQVILSTDDTAAESGTGKEVGLILTDDSLLEGGPKEESTPIKASKSDTEVNADIQSKDGHVVRIENLPPSVTQSQLEEVVKPYGQPLHMEMELRISDGEEKLSAVVKLADDSIAGFLASCLDGADTIFAGNHEPVRCFQL